jgi:uncharacterized protein
MTDRPAVGLLYNPVSPDVIARAPDLVEYLAVMPDRLLFDFGHQVHGRRFHRTLEPLECLRRLAEGRLVSGHGIGLSLPSAVPLDTGAVDAFAAISVDLGGFRWFSEHLSVFIAPKGSVPNAQAGLGMPLAYDEEALRLVSGKLDQLDAAFGCRLLFENSAFFTPVPDSDMTEPEFLTRLFEQGACGTLLDLHNLYVSWRNDGLTPDAYIVGLDVRAVEEIHLGGGDEFGGFYMDSHSTLTPPAVWQMAWEYAPCFPNLRAITFEFQETYYDVIGAEPLVDELHRMHELASVCRTGARDAG